MVFRVESDSIGDSSIPNGTLEWEEITCTADCGCELQSDEKVYLYEGKHVCKECLLEMAEIGDVTSIYLKEQEDLEADYWDSKYDEMKEGDT